MAEYNDLIKSFNTIRAAMREYYVYGFRTRGEVTFGKDRAHDEAIRRLKSWLADYVDFYNQNGKRYYLSVDSREEPHNPLFRAWKSKSYTDNEIMLHFLIFDALHTDAPAMTIRELCDSVMDDYEKKYHYQDEIEISSDSIQKKVREYINEGMIQKNPDKTVSRVPDFPLPSADFLDFFSESAPCGVIGSTLLDRQKITAVAKSVLAHEQMPKPNSRFRFKHHFITGTMDSEILFRLFQAIRAKKKTELTMFSGEKHTVVPLRIRCSAQDGRQYLMAAEKEKITYFRLNQIMLVKPGAKASNFAALSQKLDEVSPHFWGISTRGQDTGLKSVSFTIRFDPEAEYYIPNRLEREKRSGSVEIAEDSARFSIEIYDARAIFPWLRTFFCRITELALPDEKLQAAFLGDFASLCALYGVPAAAKPARPDRESGKEKTIAGKKPDNGLPSLFNEVYSEDFNTIATILTVASRAPVPEETLDKLCSMLAFEERSWQIRDALISGTKANPEKESWPLLEKTAEEEQYRSILRHAPAAPATLLQRQWLKAVMQDPRAALFGEGLPELEGIEPLYRQGDIEVFDAYGDGDPYGDEKYLANFRTILSALEHRGTPLKIEAVLPNGRPRFWQVMPKWLEYSEKDDKFRLITEQNITINLAQVASCTILDPGSALSGKKPDPEQRELVAELEDINNALERALLQFAHFKKRTEQLEDGQHYRITVTYDSDDETDLVIRALSFGSHLKVTAPDTVVEEIRTRLRLQAELFGVLPAEN